MEGKRITELSGISTAAGKGLRFSCHFEENSISFCDLEGVNVTRGDLHPALCGSVGWSLCPVHHKVAGLIPSQITSLHALQKRGGLIQSIFQPGLLGNIRDTLRVLRGFQWPVYSINLFLLWTCREIHRVPKRPLSTATLAEGL